VIVQSRPASKVRTIIINCGAGDDTVTIDLGGKNIKVIVHGGAGADSITCGAEKDIVNGDAGNDTIDGGGGDDKLNGGLGDDTVIGGTGKDSVTGGLGKDTLYGMRRHDNVNMDKKDIVVRADCPIDLHEPVVGDSTPAVTIHLDPFLKQQLIDQAVEKYKDLLGTTFIDFPWWGWYGDTIVLNSSAPKTLGLNGAALASNNHSDTNTQEAGVDEADLVETDGDYIYTLRGGMLCVIDVRDPKNAQIVSQHGSAQRLGRGALSGWESGGGGDVGVSIVPGRFGRELPRILPLAAGGSVADRSTDLRHERHGGARAA
jgi:hypothetical protein